MPLPVAELLVSAFLIYAAVGLVFALVFVWRGVGAVDPVAAEGTRGFRVLIIPGCAAFWPWLLKRWWQKSGPRDERNAHRDAATLNREAGS